MPLYSYQCKKCGELFELLVFPSDTPACPSCESTELEPQMGLIAPAGKTGDILKSARKQAAREGHFSNYKRSEIKRR